MNIKNIALAVQKAFLPAVLLVVIVWTAHILLNTLQSAVLKNIAENDAKAQYHNMRLQNK